MARFVAWLAGAIVVLLLGSSVAIFGLGYFEPGWGRAYALQVAVFVSAALAVIGAAAYTVVSIARHFHPTLLQALVAGALFQLCLFGAIEGIQRAAPALDSLAMAAVIAAALGAASSLVHRRAKLNSMTRQPTQKYRGSCHCGAVKFEIETDFPELTTCDCSICRRKNALMVKVHENQFKLLSGEEWLAEYRFHTMTARHFFCKRCGIYPFHRKRVTPDYLGINVFCLDGFDPSGIPVRQTAGASMK